MVGSVEDRGECEGGNMFHSLLLVFQVTIFSTFLGGVPTWSSAAGHFHLIVFVGIPFKWSAGVRSATTHPKVALLPHLAGVVVVVSRSNGLWGHVQGHWHTQNFCEQDRLRHDSLLRKDQGCSRRCTATSAPPGPRSTSLPSGQIHADHLGWDMSEH